MASHSILGLVYITKSLEAQGYDLLPLLQRHGIDLEHVDPQARIERSLELRLLSDIAQSLGDSAVGLQIGNGYSLAGYGPLGLLLLSCDSVLHSFQCGVRYQQLTYLFSELSFSPGDQAGALILKPLDLPEPSRRLLVDLEMAGTYKLISDLQASLGFSLRPIQVDIPYPRPADAKIYERFYGCPVRFGSSHGRFWIANEHLQLRLPSGDSTTHGFYRQQCEQLLLARQQESEKMELGEQVRAYMALFSAGFPSVARVAAALGMPERTLRHQLRSKGTSYRQILAQLRFERARQLLENSQLSVEAIAGALGYAESAAFIHAFRRWSDCSPAHYRRQSELSQ